jgi:hypothetical protein
MFTAPRVLIVVSTLLSVSLIAAEVDVQERRVDISLGESLTIVLEPDPSGALVPKQSDGTAAGQPSVSLTMTSMGGSRMLKIQNGYSKTLVLSASMCITSRNKCVPTSILPVRPRLIGFELWNDPIDMLRLSGFRFEAESNAK